MAPLLAGWLFVLVLAACSDSPRNSVAPAEQSVIRAEPAIVAPSVDAAAPYDWVGAGHNAGIDVIRSAWRAKRLAGRSACREYLELDFTALIPAALRDARSIALARQVLLEGAAAGPCQPGGKPAIRRVSSTSDLSPAAQSLLSQVDGAISIAVSPSDLASRLAPVYASAQATLSSPELEIVSGSASVAESSTSYWYSSWGGYVNDIGTQYGACLSNTSNWETCQGTLATSRSVRLGRAFVLFPLALIAGPCNYTDHPFRTLGSADFKSAIGGAISGAVMGGPQGALLGALVGGMAGSVSTAVPLGLRQFWCELQE